MCVCVFMQFDKRKFAQLIRRLRGSYSQKEFAGILGVTYGAVQSWEKAEVVPNSQNLSKVASYAGISLEDLFSKVCDDKVVKLGADRLISEMVSLPREEVARIACAAVQMLS